VSARLIAEAGGFQVTGPVAAVGYVAEAARPGDVVLIMGSGGNLAALADRICTAVADSVPATA